MKVYDRHVGIIRAKQLQEETFYDDRVKATKIFAKIPGFRFKEILKHHFVVNKAS